MSKNDFLLRRKEVVSLDTVLQQVLKGSKLLDGLKEDRLFRCWDEMIGPEAAAQCLSHSYDEGVLKVKVRSAVLRSYLSMQLPQLVARLNKNPKLPRVRYIQLL